MSKLKAGTNYNVVWSGTEFIITFEDTITTADTVEIGVDPQTAGSTYLPIIMNQMNHFNGGMLNG